MKRKPPTRMDGQRADPKQPTPRPRLASSRDEANRTLVEPDCDKRIADRYTLDVDRVLGRNIEERR